MMHHAHRLMHGLLRLAIVLVLIVFVLLNPLRTGRILYRMVSTLVMFGENIADGRYIKK